MPGLWRRNFPQTKIKGLHKIDVCILIVGHTATLTLAYARIRKYSIKRRICWLSQTIANAHSLCLGCSSQAEHENSKWIGHVTGILFISSRSGSHNRNDWWMVRLSFSATVFPCISFCTILKHSPGGPGKNYTFNMFLHFTSHSYFLFPIAPISVKRYVFLQIKSFLIS